MRKILFVFLFASLVLPACAQQSSPQSTPLKTVAMEPQAVEKLLEKRLTLNYVPGEVVVKMKPTAALRVMPSTELKRLNLEVKREQTSGSEIVYRLPPAMLSTLTKKDAGDRTLAAVKSLRARPDVEYAQPNYIFQITATPNDSGYPKQWHYFDNGSGANQAPGGINLPTAWETNKGSAAVVVAVIDTGILPNHEDISGSPNLVNGYDMISDPDIGNDGDGRDATATDPGDAIAANECYPGSPAQPNSWHGTHVAGTIGVGKTNNNLGVAGINWNVKVQPVRVLGKCGGTMVDINDAIRWAAGMPVPGVPNNPTPAKVINMSLGGASPCSASPATQAAINDAVAKGTTVVGSDRRGYLATRYSNFGARVDIMAPGGDVRQDSDNDGNPDGVLSMVDGGYAYYNGTSMAAPHTAGVAALLLAEDSTRTPDQIRSLLKARAMTRTATQCPKPCGAGLLNAAATQPVPPAPGVAITLSPPALSVEAGKSAEVSATVLHNGVADSGKNVAFVSSSTAVFSVTPTSTTTDTNGVAKATITAVTAGDAALQAESQGARATAAVKVTPKKIPALPLPFFGALLLAALLLYAWRVRRAQGA